jgi:hypothetical protein
MTQVSWSALRAACWQSSIIVIDDDVAVYADIPPAVGKIYLRSLDGDNLHGCLQEIDNTEMEAKGSIIWCWLVGEGEPSQLSFNKTWVVEDDISLTNSFSQNVTK